MSDDRKSATSLAAKFGSPRLSTPVNRGQSGGNPNGNDEYGSMRSNGSFSSNSPSMLGAIGVDPKSLTLSRKNTEIVIRPITRTPTFSRIFSKVEPGSLRGSIFTLSSSAIGAGLLSLPLVMRNTGLVLGSTLCIIGAILALLSMNMLVDTADVILFARGGRGGRMITYSELVSQILGPRWGVFLEVTLLVYCFGTIVGYLLVIGRAIGGVCAALDVGLPSEGFPIMLAALFALPLALFRDISSLALSSLLAIAAMMYVCFSITYRGTQLGTFKNIPTPIARVGSDFCSSATIVFFAYNCHVNIFSIYSSLHYPLVSRMKKVTQRSVALEVSLYLLVASSGYLIFHDDTKGNILLNFPATDMLLTIGKAGVACALTSSLPLCLHPCRENFYLLWYKFKGATMSKDLNAPLLSGQENGSSQRQGSEKPQASLLFHVLITLTMMGSALFLALNVPAVSIVFSFLGATACVIICYALPIIMYIAVLDQRSVLRSRTLVVCEKIALWALLAVLVAIGAVSAFSSLKQVLALVMGVGEI
eukprot:CAMPEP_0184499510 /NCGR_PEP_ID=MMETSP0113_2-20130426/41663_1 /TAXON_ID=91329 /ORGANISM="Norrisiella sphaerica, Strain BC52" /LENGTH=533 /DNA_ID=CAMNT_0026887433 /DNA_START=243 /DNA_END=1844 /DNA_ORIENTATION=+